MKDRKVHADKAKLRPGKEWTPQTHRFQATMYVASSLGFLKFENFNFKAHLGRVKGFIMLTTLFVYSGYIVGEAIVFPTIN